jgi:hypothetical protein
MRAVLQVGADGSEVVIGQDLAQKVAVCHGTRLVRGTEGTVGCMGSQPGKTGSGSLTSAEGRAGSSGLSV